MIGAILSLCTAVGRSGRFRSTGAVATLALTLSGCVGFSPDGGLTPAVDVASTRLHKHLVRIDTDTEAESAQARVRYLLKTPLSVDRAVQVALLSNHDLQASFHDLGVSEAEFVRASLPPDPQFSINQLAGMGDFEVVHQIVVGLYALATLPARQAIASERFKAAQARAAGQVMALAAEVSRQYFIAVAAKQEIGFLDTAVAAAQASAELAKQLGKAGNLNKLEQAREDVFYAELGAQRGDARLQAEAERERLTRLMGLWGRDITFTLPKALPPLPKRIARARDIEAKALGERLDIIAARHDLDALARELGLTNVTRYVSDISLTLQNDTEWAGNTGGSKLGTETTNKLARNGFVVDFSIPIYDFGESKVRNARETYLAAASRLAQRAIDVRSQAREAYTRYRGKYELARYYAKRILPLRNTILDQTSLQYNGMLADVTQLLLDARGRVISNIAAIMARRDFFVAEVNLKAVLIGNGPSGAAPATGPSAAATEAAN
ncbi:MAG: TolC family protein [Methylovirgula sp.]